MRKQADERFDRMVRFFEDNPTYYGWKFERVWLSGREVDKLRQFSMRFAAHKLQEEEYKKDHGSLYTRTFKGKAGELAVEKALGLTGVVDWTIGNSHDYSKPDLLDAGYNVGIKTADKELKNFPVVPMRPKYPQIIVMKETLYDYLIMGIATVEVMQQYSTLDLIRSPLLRQKGYKTAFYGFHKLLPCSELKQWKV